MTGTDEYCCEVCGESRPELIIVVNEGCVLADHLICRDCCAKCEINCVCDIAKSETEKALKGNT